ncbi:MAG: ROK family protein, partial [Acidimicrobiales bacterium]
MSDSQPPPRDEPSEPGPPATITPNPHHPLTLAVDVGGTGLKASVLDADGAMVADRVKVPTPYPIPPDKLVTTLGKLVAPLPKAERASVGFPGMVRAGRVLSAPHFSCKHGPGSSVDAELAGLWSNFDLTTALTEAFGMPTKVANDADVQGAAVVTGEGLELVVTLGTGVGTALFYEGRLLPHLELAHHPFGAKGSYNEVLGDEARKSDGKKKWNKRVNDMIDVLRALTFFDHCYIGSGNAARIT